MNPFDRIAPRFLVSCASLWLGLCVSSPATAVTTAPVATSSIFRACPDAMEHASTSVMQNNGRSTVTVKLDGGRCAVDFKLEGKAQFNDDFTDLVSLSTDGRMRMDVRDGGERRQLEIVPSRTGLVRTWKVNGQEQPYDDAARGWFAAFLVELDRRTAIGVDRRLPVLLRNGGVSAVLEETAKMPSDYARSIYYSKLAQATKLSSGDVVRVLDQAAAKKTSDYYASELMKGLGASVGGTEVRAADLRLIQGMSSDYYRAESVKQAVGSGKLGPSEMDLLISVIQKMESDYYKTEVLKQVLAGGSLTENDLLAIVKVAAPTKSDYYRSEMLRRVLAHRAVTEAVRRAALDATGDMSSYYREEVEKATGRR